MRHQNKTRKKDRALLMILALLLGAILAACNGDEPPPTLISYAPPPTEVPTETPTATETPEPTETAAPTRAMNTPTPPAGREQPESAEPALEQRTGTERPGAAIREYPEFETVTARDETVIPEDAETWILANPQALFHPDSPAGAILPDEMDPETYPGNFLIDTGINLQELNYFEGFVLQGKNEISGLFTGVPEGWEHPAETSERHAGHEVMLFAISDEGNRRERAIAQPGPGELLYGTPDGVRAILEVMAGERPALCGDPRRRMLEQEPTHVAIGTREGNEVYEGMQEIEDGEITASLRFGRTSVEATMTIAMDLAMTLEEAGMLQMLPGLMTLGAYGSQEQGKAPDMRVEINDARDKVTITLVAGYQEFTRIVGEGGEMMEIIED